MISFWIKLPCLSLAKPILLEKKGFASLNVFPKFSKRSLLSRKNCLFSGSLSSNLVIFVIISSTSTFEKSGLYDKSRFKLLPTDIFESKPLSKNQIISELKNMYENEVMEYFLQLVNNFELNNLKKDIKNFSGLHYEFILINWEWFFRKAITMF